MGLPYASAYSLGVAFGTTSYQVSVGQTGLAGRIAQWQFRADALVQSHLLGATFAHLAEVNVSSNEAIIAAREQMELRIRENSQDAANIFHLGLLNGIAEGEASGPAATGDVWGDKASYPAGYAIANDSLRQAQNMLGTSLAILAGVVPMGDLETAERNMSTQYNGSIEDAHAQIQQMNVNFFNAIDRAVIPSEASALEVLRTFHHHKVPPPPVGIGHKA